MKNKKKKMNFFIGSAQGQAFEAYRVLIAGVIALAVLVIIVSVISYFDTLRQNVSLESLYSGWKSAVDSPNGKIVRVGNLSFTKDTRFSKSQFARQVSLDNECIEFDNETLTGYSREGEAIVVTGNVLGAVFMQCVSSIPSSVPSTASCYAYCLISFGKAIPSQG